jgi:glycosyltransferase involved in cell wall biosynthesis
MTMAFYRSLGISERSLPTVLVIGALPPPRQGMPTVTQAVLNRIKVCCNTKVVNLSSSGKQGLAYSLRKAVKIFVGVLSIVRASTKPVKRLYMPVDAGLGMYYTLLLSNLAKLFGFNIFLHHHSWAYISRKDWRMKLLVRLVGKKLIHIILCDKMRQEFCYIYPTAENVIKLSNAAFYPPPSISSRRQSQCLTLGHLSNLTIEKGLLIVIETFRKLLAENIGAKLILAGPAMSDIERRAIKKARLEFGDLLQYKGPVYGKEKEMFFEEIDVFLFPTMYKNEAQPLVMFEALKKGIPFVSFARGCIPSDLEVNGGICIGKDNDFPKYALPILMEWASNREKLWESSRLAAFRASQLNDLARNELEQLVEKLSF